MRRTLLFLAGMLVAFVARAACIEPGGMGGTGISSDGGMGGTGIRADAEIGLVGVITGFGSICVNGVEVAYDARTSIASADGSSELAIGQVVAVHAVAEAAVNPKGNALQLRAERIQILEPALGRPSGFVPATGRLQVGAQRVQLDEATVLEGVSRQTLAAAAALRVSGLARADGTLHATRIERAPDDAAPRAARTTWPELSAPRQIIEGYVERAELGSVTIAGLRFEADARLAGTLRRDELVRLSARVAADGRRIVERADVLRSPLDVRPERTISRETRGDSGDVRPDRGGRGDQGDAGRGDRGDSGRVERPDRPERGGRDRPERSDRGGRN
jgi:hypothetical protein